MLSEEKKESPEIQKIIIKGFKRIKGPLEINLAKPLTILVGDNGAGKTTILEAIQLACTGQYRGESIRRALSQSLFNKGDGESFLNSSDLDNTKRLQQLQKLPSIKVEVFLTGGEQDIVERFSGANNSTKARCCGFSLDIDCDNDFKEELAGILKSRRLTSVPIEYYDAKWMTFGGAIITPRQLPVHSVMMNPTGEWLGNRSDERATRILIDGLTERQQMAFAQDARTAFDSWNNKASNNFLPSFDAYDWGTIDLAVDSGTVDSWKRNIVVRLDSIPYGHIGSGSQSTIQAWLALRRKQRPEKTTMLLFEEPENHLSHANLNRLIRLIAEGAEGRKVVVSTHSSFVANTLGLQNLQLIGSNAAGPKCLPLNRLDDQTLDFFKKLPGYDTLRLVLARAAILVEGPSDELIVQLAYRQKHNKLPIEEGIDVISVGSGFLRFLVLACAIGKPVLVLTDNDGDPESLRKK